MQIILFGCKDTTLHTSKYLYSLGVKIHLVTISSTIAKKNEVAGYMDLTLHKEFFVSIYQAETYSLKDSKDKLFFHRFKNISLGFCIGWQRIIPKDILELFHTGIFGMHGSARDLPLGKGRSPMNWAILEGRKFFHTNLFKYKSGVDNGPILDKNSFSINEKDNIETLHYKNMLAMCHLIEKNLSNLFKGTIKTKSQKNVDKETFYPKRSPKDGCIDWEDDIQNIDRLIRAVAPPFYGAFTLFNNSDVKIFRADIFYTDIEQHPFKKIKFGIVADVFPNGKFLVRCSGGVIIVHEYDGFEPIKGTKFQNKNPPLKFFKRNEYGFFDV